jgi:hypothetical protein
MSPLSWIDSKDSSGTLSPFWILQPEDRKEKTGKEEGCRRNENKEIRESPL